MFFEHDSIAQCRRRLELLVLGSSQGACHPLWSQMLSHIVVKGNRSSKFVVCTGSVRAQHAEQLISGLKYKLAGSVLRRWRSPVRIRLAAPGYSEFQNCTKYSAMKNTRSPKAQSKSQSSDSNGHATPDLELRRKAKGGKARRPEVALDH
jgi:hypothetical protein